MAKTIATPSRPYTTPCDAPQQPCPECGGLECLCRPRFFAGQLLTEDDLNLLNHYIIEKNKLHNRYLHGWGVVCGLEVVCDPCSGVVVNPGYALSPCGEDIIVCKKQVVDVCSLIKACKKPRNNCDPLDAFTQNDNCLDTTEKWVLAIRYHEKATRGVTSLKGASGSSCCSKCACGGSSNCGCGGSRGAGTSSSGDCGCSEDCDCGCGCGGASTSRVATSVQKPPQCEPTAICEGFTFEVCKMPPNPPAPVSPLVERLQCCVKLLQAVIPPIPQQPTGQNLQNWCCQLRENLADLFAAHPGHACQLTTQLGTLCQNAANSTLQQVLLGALPYLFQFFLDCICSGLLPPCPGPVMDDRLFLATITVSRKDCRIIQICNWDVRKFAVTFPMLGYWLSPLQLGTAIKKAIANLCCNTQLRQFKVASFDQNQAFRFQSAQYPPTPEQRSATFSRVVADSLSAAQPIGADTLLMADVGALDSDKQPLLSDAQMQMPIETLLLNQIALPLLSNLEGMTGLTDVVSGARSESADVADLRAQIASLNSTINQHTATIADLSAKLGKQ